MDKNMKTDGGNSKTQFGEQIGETRVGKLYESVTLSNGNSIKIGDVVTWVVPSGDLNPYKNPREEPIISEEVCTGTVEKIWKMNRNGEAQLAITNDNYGRIPATDVLLGNHPNNRFDRFRSEIPSNNGCIIERWWTSYSDVEPPENEYEVEVNSN